LITPDVIAAAILRLRNNSKHDVETGCIEVTCYLSNKGYGQIKFKGKMYLMHRIMAVAGGKMLPDSPLVVDHLCSNKTCINPEHLEAVTSSVNNKRAYERGEKIHHGLKITHCPKGHEYSETNTRYSKDRQQRNCRACDRFRKAESRRKARNNNNNNNQKAGINK